MVFGYNSAYAGENDKEVNVLRGREIFHERCAICHGADGIPLLQGVPEFAKGERLDKPDEELLNSIQHGKGIMPPWGEVLADKERKDALRYARVIAGDKVFAEKCLKCHGKGYPELGDNLRREDLGGSAWPFDICRGCDIEKELTKEDALSVIKFLRILKNKK